MYLCYKHIYIFLQDLFQSSFSQFIFPSLSNFGFFSRSTFIHSQFIVSDLLINTQLKG